LGYLYTDLTTAPSPATIPALVQPRKAKRRGEWEGKWRPQKGKSTGMPIRVLRITFRKEKLTKKNGTSI